MELVVFVVSLKFFFVEGGEQFIVGMQTVKKIGINKTIRITVAGISFATILFFLLFYSHALISTRWLELALAITLYFFAASISKRYLRKNMKKKNLMKGPQIRIYHDCKFGVGGKCNSLGCINLYRY
jgi:uncharacterized membrane protein